MENMLCQDIYLKVGCIAPLLHTPIIGSIHIDKDCQLLIFIYKYNLVMKLYFFYEIVVETSVPRPVTIS